MLNLFYFDFHFWRDIYPEFCCCCPTCKVYTNTAADNKEHTKIPYKPCSGALLGIQCKLIHRPVEYRCKLTCQNYDSLSNAKPI